MSIFKKIWDGYFIWHANRIKIPPFSPSFIIRKRVTFSGKVQKVGFRLAVYCLAERLKLTGWVKNLEDGSVEAELQGEESKIYFLINCMQSLKRASVKSINTIDLPICQDEKNFTILK